MRIQVAAWAHAESTCDFLQMLRAAYPGRALLLLWDNVPYHRAHVVKSQAQQLGIELMPLASL